MSATALTAFEHQSLSVSPSGNHDSLSEAEAEHLQWISESLPGFCTRGYRSLKLTQHCGLVNLGGRILEILPKVGEESDAAQSRGVLLRLLCVAYDLPIHRQASASQSVRPAPLIDVFIQAFFEEVMILLKGGLLRRYTEHEDDLVAVRGTIRLQRQSTVLANRTDRVACRYDDLTADHRWNRLLKAGLRVVRPWIRSLDLQRTWVELSAAFEEVSDVPQPRALLTGLAFDRQATRYRPAISWVERILNLLTPDLRLGEKVAPGLLFDMNRLFEDVVEQRMGNWLAERGWSIEAQASTRYLTQIVAAPRRNAFKVRPDLLFKRRDQVAAIADAKWKHPALSQSGFILPDQADLYQLCAYAAVFRCEHLALIYPWDERLAVGRETVFELPHVGGRPPKLTVFCLDITQDGLPLILNGKTGCWSDSL